MNTVADRITLSKTDMSIQVQTSSKNNVSFRAATTWLNFISSHVILCHDMMICHDMKFTSKSINYHCMKDS